MPQEPTRFENGVSDTLTGMWAQAPFLNPVGWHVYFNDFDTYVVGDWTITTTEAGAGSATEALGNVDGGILVITNDAADNDNDFFQKVGESFKFAAGKRLFFETRFKILEVIQCDAVLGLQITDTSPLAVTDGVYFITADGAATVDFVSLMNSAGVTSAAVATLVADTYIRLGFYYDGASNISVYVNDVKIIDVTVAAGTTLCNDEDLTISFGIQNGEAVANILTMDYIYAAKER